MLLNNNTEEFLLQIKETTMLDIIDNQLWQLLVCKDTVALGRRAKFKADVFERYPFEEISSIGLTFLWILSSKSYPAETGFMWRLY